MVDGEVTFGMTLLSSVLGDAAVTDALRVTLLMFRTEELLRHGCRRGKAERLGLSPEARIARTFQWLVQKVRLGPRDVFSEGLSGA